MPPASVGFPSNEGVWVVQYFTVPADWDQLRVTRFVQRSWRLHRLRPLFFEFGAVRSVMFSVDAARGVRPGRLHLNLSLRDLSVQPVFDGLPEWRDHVVRDSPHPAPGDDAKSRVCPLSCCACGPGVYGLDARGLPEDYRRASRVEDSIAAEEGAAQAEPCREVHSDDMF